MANRLYSDIRDSSGRRYYFDLDSSPGICIPGVGTLTLTGQEPQYPGTVFRTPATTVLTLQGLSVGPSGTILSPARAALAFSNAAIGQLGLHRTITLGLESPVESPDQSFAPTISFVNTITPSPATLTTVGYNHSLSEGGNIGFLHPPQAALSLIGYQYTRIIPPAPPEEGVDGQVGTATITGLEPNLVTSLVIEPGVSALSMGAPAQRVDRGFIWIDDDPAPPLSWSV